ncbi:MAG: glycosyltransferase [Lachnospiraceae bacterium]|nr:glycosyltransferase [Lachnospiraceae bacterium]
MANILIVTHWTGGDVIPFIRMGKVLKQNKHDVTIFTHCVYEKLAVESGLQFVALDTEEEHREMTDNLMLLSDPIHNLQGTVTFNEKFHNYEKLINEYEKIIAYCDRSDTVIIFRHRSSISALIAAEKHNIPVASVFLAPNYIDHLSIHEMIMGEIMLIEINKARIKLELEPIKNWTEWICSPEISIGLWPDWFADKGDEWPSSLVTLDFHQNEDENSPQIPEELAELFSTDEKLIIISGGTSKMIKPEFYQVAHDTCYMLGLKALLVIPHDELIPISIKSGIAVRKHIPLKEVMHYAKAIIHHGGIGTLSEAVYAGIPQLILPFYADRSDNAARLAKYGIAEFLPVAMWKPAFLAEALLRLFQPGTLKKCRDFSQKAKNQNFSDKINRIIEQMVKK